MEIVVDGNYLGGNCARLPLVGVVPVGLVRAGDACGQSCPKRVRVGVVRMGVVWVVVV